MREILLTIVFFSVFGIMIETVYAASFTASMTPTNLNAKETGAILNFTITNTDGAENITAVNISLPYGFSYSGNVRQDIGTFSLLENGRILSWVLIPNLIPAGNTENFWLDVTAAQEVKEHYFNVTTKGVSGTFTSQNLTFTIVDLIAPKWSANTTAPASPTTYVYNQNYTFNISWSDNVNLDTVTFEWEGVNYTNITAPDVESQGSGNYGFSLKDLTVGNYTYRWYANDSNGTQNSTGEIVYTVDKLSNPISIYLNGNPNANLMLNDQSELNITVVSEGMIYVYENERLIVSGTGPLTSIRTLSVGTYVYKANSSSTANRTQNSTGHSQTVEVVVPPPMYSIVADIPDIWYKDAFATWNITFSDMNDPNGFDTAYFETNHSGTLTNFTLNHSDGSNKTSYEINLSNPVSFTWRIYVNNSYGSWNSSEKILSNVSKIIPTYVMNATPDWEVLRGTETLVFCAANSDLAVRLYRNDKEVDNPDRQTLASGVYTYTCNNTETNNYSSSHISELMYVMRYSKSLSFSEYEEMIYVAQNGSNKTIVNVANKGNRTHYVSLGIEGIDERWYKVNSSNISVKAGELGSFEVLFNIIPGVDVDDYAGKFVATIDDNIEKVDFIVRVTPDPALRAEIDEEISILSASVSRIQYLIDEAGKANTTNAQTILDSALQKIEEAKRYADKNDYFNAYRLLDGVIDMIKSAEEEVTLAKAKVEIESKERMRTWIYASAVIIAMGVIAFLFWPDPGYDPRTKKYRYKSSKQEGIEKVVEAKDKIKEKVLDIKKKASGKRFDRGYEPISERQRFSSKNEAIDLSKTPFEIDKYGSRKPHSSSFTRDLNRRMRKSLEKLKDKTRRKEKYEEVELTDL